MIFAQAPTRLSLFGGGSDTEPYASKYGGICLNLAINLRQHFTFNEGNDNVYPVGADPFFYKKFFDEFDWHPHAVISTFDSIVESGIGASASAAVALVAACAKAKGIVMSREEIAEKAWDIEVNKLGLFGGKQDQYAASLGGGNLLLFEDKVYHYPLSKHGVDKLYPNLLLFYTGRNRKSSAIQEGLKELSPSQIVALDEIKEIAYEAIDAVNFGAVEEVGALLDKTWEAKKRSNEGVTSDRIDEIYQEAKAGGALGGKILGAGGGGHILLLALPEFHKEITDTLIDMECTPVDFAIDWQGVEVRKI